MTRDEIRATVFRILGQIAPEADVQRLKPTVRLRQQLDLDSMDFLNFLIALDKDLKIEIPERDYPKLATLDGLLTYLESLLAAPRPN